MADDSKVKWDIDQLANGISSLTAEHRNLTSHKNYLEGLRGQVSANWQSPAGRQYIARLASEIKTLDEISKQVNDQVQALQKAKDTYQACETDLQNGLRRLSRSV